MKTVFTKYVTSAEGDFTCMYIENIVKSIHSLVTYVFMK